MFSVERFGLALDEDQEQAVALLALFCGQDVEPGDKAGTWRIAERTAPDRVISVVDPESRHAHKTSHSYRDGYKAHVAAEPETGIITATDLSAGNVADSEPAISLLEDEPEGTVVFADSAYGSGELRSDLEAAGFHTVIKPAPLRAAVPGGYTIDDFTISDDEQTITCPAGVTVTITPKRRARFAKHCQSCPLKRRCTKSKAGRTIVFHEHHDVLREARRHAMTDGFQDAYRTTRPMIDRTIAWLVYGGSRRLRYRGTEKNRLWLSLRAAAVNLKRLVNLGIAHDGASWVMETP